MATSSQIKSFIQKVVPLFQKYGSQYKFHIISFAIAQACYESGYGTSAAAKSDHNILGIGPGKYYTSWDACVKGYYTDTVLGSMKEARDATTLAQYYQAFVKSKYCPGTEKQYYAAIKSIIDENKLTQYDAKNGKSLANSTTNILQKFLNVAEKHANGESFEAWAQGVLGITWWEEWCCDYICACAKEVGVLGKLIARVAWVDGLLDETASQCNGKIHLASSGYTPQPGDMVTWKRAGESSGYHVGIVNRVQGDTLYTFEGNHTNALSAKVEHSLKDSQLYRYCHPDWESMGGYSDGISSDSSSSISAGGPLYSSEYTRADAILREVAYINSKSERTLTKTGIHLSVMNYTTMLADLWRVLGYSTGEDSENNSDTSSLSGNVKTTVDYLMKKGLNSAAACGVAGNIYYESNFNPAAVGDGGTSFGICQWHDGRGSEMKKQVGANWASNLTGQLDYLWYELKSSYQGTLSRLKSVSNTTSGAKNAADYFVRNFEVPADVNNESVKRQNKAVEYFAHIDSGGVVSDGSLTNKQKKVISAAQTTPSPGAGWCAAWVTNVFTAAGIGTWYGNACDLYHEYCKSKNRSTLKPGMIIAVDSWDGNDDSRTYGHIGIYIGNTTVRHNIGDIIETPLQDWISQYQTYADHPVKWGWMGNTNLAK